MLSSLLFLLLPINQFVIGISKIILAAGGIDEKVSEAGACLAEGHSTDNEEPMYGLAVTGVVSPQRVLTNDNAQGGDALILTKPLGTGVLFMNPACPPSNRSAAPAIR
jgi:selenide, water dikinase